MKALVQHRVGQIDPSLFSQVLIQVVQRSSRIRAQSETSCQACYCFGRRNYQSAGIRAFLPVGDRISVADIAAAAPRPLALIPQYRQEYPWLFERIEQINCVRTVAGLAGEQGR